MAKKRADGRLKKTFTVDGKRYSVYGHSKKELTEKEYDKRQRIAAGEQRRSNPTIEQFHDTWIENKRGTVKATTIHTYNSFFDTAGDVHIDSRKFKELKIRKITAEDIRTVQRELLQAGKTTNTVNQIIHHINSVMRSAVNDRVISFNPCTTVKPLQRTEERARDTKHRALTKEETAAFMAAAAGSYYYNVFRLAINTGMRIGEIGALYNTDIRNGCITIERTLTVTESGAVRIGDSAKTATGRRTIPVNGTISAIIREQKELNRALDGAEVLHDVLFKTPERHLLRSSQVNTEIRNICRAAGIKEFSMHAFRATFATRAIEQGINPRTVQELLGHADFSLTMNLYGHVLEDTKREAMESIAI